jgi:hypothetical protein
MISKCLVRAVCEFPNMCSHGQYGYDN